MQLLATLLQTTLTVCYTASGLQCKFCVQYEGHSVSQDEKLQSSLTALRHMGNNHCRDSPDDPSVSTLTCPISESKKAVCGTATVAATYDAPGAGDFVTVGMYMRACYAVDVTRPMSECEDLKDYKDEIQAKVPLRYADIDGIFCACQGDQCNVDGAPSVALYMSAGGTEASSDVITSALLGPLFTKLVLVCR